MATSSSIAEVLVRPRGAFVPFPGLTCIDRPDWHQLITPSFKEGGLNAVSLAVLDAGNVDQVIDETLRGYYELGVQFRWTVGPDSRPLDLGARLEARGLRPISFAGLAATTDGDAGDSAIEVQVVDADSVDEFSDVMMAGWDLTSPATRDYNSHVVREAPAKNPLFLARIDDKAVAVASYVSLSTSAHLLGGVVLPDFRSRGVYHALVWARREHARAAGIPRLTCHAMLDSSAPILESMGFETVCRFTSYVNE